MGAGHEYEGGTCTVSCAADVLGMGVMRGMRGVGGLFICLLVERVKYVYICRGLG